MGIKYFSEPSLRKPTMIASWPGIGNIGVLAVDTFRQMVMAEAFAEIEPWDFFYPKQVIIRHGRLEDITFPSNTFYFKKTAKKDLIFFVGEEQPSELGREYAEGRKAYQVAELVVEVARKYDCERIYTSGAAVAPVHHTARPRVWAVPNMASLLDEVKRYPNTIRMSDVEERGGEGSITGLNGLLLGVARKHGLEAVCFMGEIPVYLQGLSLSYPKASKSVLEVIGKVLGLSLMMEPISRLAARSEREIESLYNAFPPEIRDQLDKLKYLGHTTPAPSEPGPITEDDKKQILEEIDKFFKNKDDKED